MAATVPFDMLAEIQGWAPGGGFVRSERRKGYQIEPGDLMRAAGEWVTVTAHGEAVSLNKRGEVLDVSPVISWRDVAGDGGHRVLYAGADAEVRTDTRIDPATIPAP